MNIDDLEARLQALSDVLSGLGLGKYDVDLAVGDDALGAVEEGVNGLALDLETLHLANEEKAAYLELQQRALTANLGTLPDVAGSLAVVAGRAGTGLNMKIRALQDGMNSLTMQIEQALKMAHEMPPEEDKETKPS